MMNDGKLEDDTAQHANQRQSREDVALKINAKLNNSGKAKSWSQRVGPLVGVPALVVPVTEQNRSNGTQILLVHRQATVEMEDVLLRRSLYYKQLRFGAR
jgi:hypothetical protein